MNEHRMNSASGYYLNVFTERERSWDDYTDIFVIFNEANDKPTAEELEQIHTLIEQHLENGSKQGKSCLVLEDLIESSGLNCVQSGIQVVFK